MGNDGWSWIYLGLAGLGEIMVETLDADSFFDGMAKPSFITVRHFTHVKMRKETRDEMQARAKAYKIEMPIQETLIETFPWAVEQEGAVKDDGILFTHSITWVRRPCDELVEAANKLWTKSSIIAVKV